MRKALTALWALVLMVACIPAVSPAPGACRHTLVLSLDPAFTAAEKDDVARAALAWNESTNGARCFVFSDDFPDVHVKKAAIRDAICQAGDWADCAHVGGLSKPGTIWIVTEDWDDDTKAKIAVHELGHAMGLSHNDGPYVSVMNESVEKQPPFTGVIPKIDVEALAP